MEQLYESFPIDYKAAKEEAKKMELGVSPSSHVDELISKSLRGSSEWILLGGPPPSLFTRRKIENGWNRSEGSSNYALHGVLAHFS